MTNRQQPNWRSLLFVPVTAERFVAKAHTRGADAIILDLDDEWTGLDEILVSIGSGDSRQDAIWDGEPMVIEHIDFPIGYLPVSVTGRTKDGSRFIATARAPHVFFVVRNGRSGQ